MSRVTSLSPAGYRRVPWRNGGGVTVDIAFDGEVWRFSRTPITTAGAFSDYAGYERLHVLVDDKDASRILTRRAALFEPEPDVWEIKSKFLVEPRPMPVPDHESKDFQSAVF